MRRALALVLALLLLTVTTAGGVRLVDSWSFDADDLGSETDPPAGWRWESYGGLEVAVPGDWGWTDSTMRLESPCGNADTMVVGRPSGFVLLCGSPETPPRDPGWVVGFLDAPGHPDGVDHEHDRSTVWLDGVQVVIQAPALLRNQIAATIHRVRIDSSDCPVTHPVTRQPRLRPTTTAAVTTLRAVTAVSACRYRVHDPGVPESLPLLFSSLRLEGAAAGAAIREISQLPPGGGPNHPDQCLPEHSDGPYLIVLRVRSAAGHTEIMLRYSGCDHNGFDDGVTVRTLTPAAIAPFMTGSNHMISGEHALW